MKVHYHIAQTIFSTFHFFLLLECLLFISLSLSLSFPRLYFPCLSFFKICFLFQHFTGDNSEILFSTRLSVRTFDSKRHNIHTSMHAKFNTSIGNLQPTPSIKRLSISRFLRLTIIICIHYHYNTFSSIIN